MTRKRSSLFRTMTKTVITFLRKKWKIGWHRQLPQRMTATLVTSLRSAPSPTFDLPSPFFSRVYFFCQCIYLFSYTFTTKRGICEWASPFRCHNPITTAIVDSTCDIIITAWTTLMLDDCIAAMPHVKLEHILPCRCEIWHFHTNRNQSIFSGEVPIPRLPRGGGGWREEATPSQPRAGKGNVF